jgi:hypothetical protein
MSGWIKVFREFADWEWFAVPEMVQVFIYLLINANFEDKKWQGKVVEKGQLITSVDAIKCTTHLSTKQIRTCLSRLEQTGEICRKTTNKYTLITICNYERYQSSDECEGQTKGKQKANEGQSKGNQRATTKEYKNIINNNISLVSTKEIVETPSPRTENPSLEVQAMWNNTCVSLPRLVKMTDVRKNKIRLRLQEMGGDDILKGLATMQEVFTLIEQSNFLKGENKNNWKASFDWVMDSPNNWVKIIEGNYKNNNNGNNQSSNSNLEETARAIDLAFAML